VNQRVAGTLLALARVRGHRWVTGVGPLATATLVCDVDVVTTQARAP